MTDILNHDQAISAICDCTRTTSVLSYQEAIEGYFKLRGLPIPPAQQFEEENEAECARILAMSPEELDTHIRAQGDDPAAVVRRFDRLTKNAVEIVKLRAALKAVEGGSFDGASNYIIGGDWKGAYGQLQALARAALT